MEMPSQEEQTIAERYVLERKLPRPDTDFRKAVKCVSLFFGSTFFAALISFCLLQRLGIFALLPERIIVFQQSHSTLFVLSYFLLCYVISGICCLRMAAIGAVKLYQHYAHEDIRRRCLFKPTCSEYAILALKKYGVIIGLIKTYNRLFRKCRGNIYRIDYP